MMLVWRLSFAAFVLHCVKLEKISYCDKIQDKTVSCFSTGKSDLLIKHPNTSLGVKISVTDGYFNSDLSIECSEDSSVETSILDDLPSFGINLSSDLVVSWISCPLPNISFLTIITKFCNFSNIRLVSIDNNRDTLNKNHLKDLQVEELTVNVTKYEFDSFDEIQVTKEITICNVMPHDGTFRNQINLEAYRIEDVMYGNASAGMFEGLSKVEYLYVDHSSFHFNVDSLKPLSNLQYFLMGGLSQINLTAGMFQHSMALKLIEMEKSKLQFPDGLFEGLQKVLGISLRFNHIKELPENLFSTFIDINYLDLSQNEIESFPEKFFKNLWTLSAISLSFNRLTNFDFLAYASYQFLNGNFNLKIEIDNNNLTELKLYDFKDFNKVEMLILNVDDNAIEMVDMGFAGYLSCDVVVHFDHNPLKCDCKNYKFLYFLQNKPQTKYQKLTFLQTSLSCYGQPNEPIETYDLFKISCPYDGECPSNCKCSTIPRNDSNIIDCSAGNFSEATAVNNFKTTNDIILRLNDNNLIHLLIDKTRNEHTIDVTNNKIKSIEIREIPTNLKVLKLSKNRIKQIESKALKLIVDSNISLSLNENLWNCDCSSLDLWNFVNSNHKRILDYDELKCVSGELFMNLSADILCPGYEVEIAVVAIVVAVLGAAFAVYYKYQKVIKMWLYINNYCSCFLSDAEFEKDKRYDAFVMYSYEDGDFVADHLVADLEQKEGYKLCCHERDWPGGPLIIDLISESIENSRRVIIVLSNNFLKSDWCAYEFRAAHNDTVMRKKSKLVVVLLEDVDFGAIADQNLRDYVKMNSYIKWKDPYFHIKLKYAMLKKRSNKNMLSKTEVVETAV